MDTCIGYDDKLEKLQSLSIGKVRELLAYADGDERLEDWLDDVDADMIEWAIREAAEHNKRNWKYIEGILRNHFNAGRTTLSQVQDAQRNFKRQDADLGVYKDDNLDYAELEKIMQEKM